MKDGEESRGARPGVARTIPGLKVAVTGPVARVIFDRPEVRNALSAEMVKGLGETLRRLEDDADVRCIILTGAGEHFVGGGDVKAFEDSLSLSPAERKHRFEERVSASISFLSVLESIGKPTIARVRGAVAGAGISFVLACDFAIGAESCFFVFAHRFLSLPPDVGLSYFLPRIVGWRRAKQLTLLGARLDSGEALREGLITQRVPDIELDAACEALAAKLVDGPPIGARLTKHLINDSLGRELAAQVRMEAGAVGECVASEDFAEGVRAFLEKRKARFFGR
jgi:2-(1,2-epoxy-1,2-dihydrophenyl)acetyl-CoA isomerase